MIGYIPLHLSILVAPGIPCLCPTVTAGAVAVVLLSCPYIFAVTGVALVLVFLSCQSHDLSPAFAELALASVGKFLCVAAMASSFSRNCWF